MFCLDHDSSNFYECNRIHYLTAALQSVHNKGYMLPMYLSSLLMFVDVHTLFRLLDHSEQVTHEGRAALHSPTI